MQSCACLVSFVPCMFVLFVCLVNLRLSFTCIHLFCQVSCCVLSDVNLSCVLLCFVNLAST